MVRAMMKTIVIDPARTRYVMPFPRVAKAVGAVVLLCGPLFLLGVIGAAVPGPVLAVTAAASLIDVLIGLILCTGARHVEVDRTMRRIGFGATVLGLVLPLTGHRIDVGPRATLGVSSSGSGRVAHDVSLAQGGQRARILSFTTREQAQRFAQLLAETFRIDVTPGGSEAGGA